MGGSTVGGNTGRAPTRTSSTKPPVKQIHPPSTVRKTTGYDNYTTRQKTQRSLKDPMRITTTRRAMQFFTAKNYTAALTATTKRQSNWNPSLANAQYRIGWIKNDQEDYEEAIEPA